MLNELRVFSAKMLKQIVSFPINNLTQLQLKLDIQYRSNAMSYSELKNSEGQFNTLALLNAFLFYCPFPDQRKIDMWSYCISLQGPANPC